MSRFFPSARRRFVFASIGSKVFEALANPVTPKSAQAANLREVVLV